MSTKYMCSQKDRQCALPVQSANGLSNSHTSANDLSNSCTWSHGNSYTWLLQTVHHVCNCMNYHEEAIGRLVIW